MTIKYFIKNLHYMQYIGTFLASLTIACCGMYTSWSSPNLPKLTSENSPIGVTLTSEEASWVASSFLLGFAPGAIIAGLIVEKIGRRGSLLMCAIPIYLPWIAIIFVNSAWLLMVARFVAGTACGVAIVIVPMYIGEIAENDIRGKLGTMVHLLKLIGSLSILCLAPFTSYTILIIIASVVPLLFLISFYFMPETPYYLIKVGKKQEAREVLLKLASNSDDSKIIDKRLSEIEETVENDMKNKSTILELFSKQYWKPLAIMIGVKTLQQFSGLQAIYAYTQTIIRLTESSLSAEASSIICGVLQIPAVLIATFLVDKLGRRPLFVVSTLGCGLALIGEGFYFYLQDVIHAEVVKCLSWLPSTGLVLFLVLNPIGIFTLPFVLMGELFPTNIKGIAVSVVSVYGGFLSFVVVKCFNPIVQTWGMHTVFWMFASICILGCIFILMFLPETKGKTFTEIQNMLNHDRSNNNNVNNEIV